MVWEGISAFGKSELVLWKEGRTLRNTSKCSRIISFLLLKQKNMNFSKITLQFIFRRQQEQFSKSPKYRLWNALHVPLTWIQLKMSGVFFQDQFMAMDINMTLKKIWEKWFGVPGETWMKTSSNIIIKTLISSMKNRCIDVISKKGGLTTFWNVILFAFK